MPEDYVYEEEDIEPSHISCFRVLEEYFDSDDDLYDESKCKLSIEENELFNRLPVWHRSIFINFPGEWEITKIIIDDQHKREVGNKFINKWLIKCSIKKVISGCKSAIYLWNQSERFKHINVMSEEMSIYDIGRVVFPLIAYMDIIKDFERLAEIYFDKENINISELESAVSSSMYFLDYGVLVAHVWRRYLDDKQAYVALYQESVKRAVFGGKTAEPEPHETPPQPEPIPPPTKKTETQRRDGILNEAARKLWLEGYRSLKAIAVRIEVIHKPGISEGHIEDIIRQTVKELKAGKTK